MMLHFPDETERLMGLSSDKKKEFLRNVDLATTRFEIKIADFGYSKKLKNKDQVNKTICGTPLYMAP